MAWHLSKRKLTARERAYGIARIARITYHASPLAVFVKFANSLISALLPIVTAFFAGLTTTALAQAYAGDETAGTRAIWFVIITAVLGVLATAWSSLERYINQFARYKIDVAVSDELYEHFLSLDFWRYDDKKTADLFDKAQQFTRSFGYIFDSLMSIATSLLATILGIVAMMFVSWWLGLIILVAVVPGVILQWRLSQRQVRHWQENVVTRRTRSLIEWDMIKIDRIADLRLYGLVRHILDMRKSLRDKDEKIRIEFEREYIWKSLATDAIEAGAEVVSLLYITTQIIQHAQPIGQFLYVQQTVSRTLSGVRSFAGELNRIDEDMANLFDYNEFMSLPKGTKGDVRIDEMPQRLSVDDVTFRYMGSKRRVLNGVSLSLQKGERIAIVGENGAGKSTLVKLILGLYQPEQGTIFVDGKPLTNVRLEDWHRQIGVLQQDYSGYTFATAGENVYLGDVSRSRSKRRYEAAIELAEVKSVIEKLPKGADTFISPWMEYEDGSSGVDLSGGQWQRLVLARNFYRDSPLLVLDEPTSAVDALAESRIFKRLFEMKDKTIITVSHRLSTVKRADRIYVMEDGRIVEQGTHSELVEKKGAYFTLFESQL